MVVASAVMGAVPAWDGDDDDMTAVAGAIVVTAFKEEPAPPAGVVPQIQYLRMHTL